jgi:uncharacterized protein
MKFLITVVALLALTPATAQTGPSYDCRRASSEDEVTICYNPTLSNFDQKEDAFYRAVLKAMPLRRAQLKADEDAWVGYRKRCGNDTECISRAYQERVHDLDELVQKDYRCKHQSDFSAPYFCNDAGQFEIAE